MQRTLVIALMSLSWSAGVRAYDDDCGCDEIDALKTQLDIQRENQARYRQAADKPETPSSAGANTGERPLAPREEAAAQAGASASPNDPPIADGCTEQAPDERVGWVDHSSGRCVTCVRKRWKEITCKQMWDATRQHEARHCSIESSPFYMLYLLARYGSADRAQAAGEVLAHQVEIEALEKARADIKKKKSAVGAEPSPSTRNGTSAERSTCRSTRALFSACSTAPPPAARRPPTITPPA